MRPPKERTYPSPTARLSVGFPHPAACLVFEKTPLELALQETLSSYQPGFYVITIFRKNLSDGLFD